MIKVKVLFLVSPECREFNGKIKDFFSYPRTTGFAIEPVVINTSRPTREYLQHYDYAVVVVKRHETEATDEKPRGDHYADAYSWASSFRFSPGWFCKAIVDDSDVLPITEDKAKHYGKIDDLLPNIYGTIYEAFQEREQE